MALSFEQATAAWLDASKVFNAARAAKEALKPSDSDEVKIAAFEALSNAETAKTNAAIAMDLARKALPKSKVRHYG